MQKKNPAITGNIPFSPDYHPGYHYATGPPDIADVNWPEKIYQQN